MDVQGKMKTLRILKSVSPQGRLWSWCYMIIFHYKPWQISLWWNRGPS